MLPEEFQKKMRELLGDSEYEAFRKSRELERTYGLRINPLKGGEKAEAFFENRFTLRPVPWCGTGYFYQQEERPGRTALHEAGAFYLQEPSAMSVAELAMAGLPEEEGREEWILDLCAAPGGKSTQLAGKMAGRGLLWSNEIHPGRAKILSQNLERMGVRNAIVSNESPSRLAERLPETFDRVIVDAPCSGEGMFRKSQEAIRDWSPENVALCAERQQEILAAADRLLKPGGILVYSTCTFSPEEDERAVEAFLASRGPAAYEILNRKEEKSPGREKSFGECFSEGRPEWSLFGEESLKDTFRLFPHLLPGEGHFAAVLRKAGGERDLPGGEGSFAGAASFVAEERLPPEGRSAETRQEGKKPKKGKPFPGKSARGKTAGISAGLSELFSQILSPKAAARFSAIPPERFLPFGGHIHLLPEGAPELSGLKILRPGLHVAEEKNGRYEPAHALAMALSPLEAARAANFPETAGETAAYLRGESFPYAGEKGWYLICAEGYSLGWGKCDGRTMKNHYPKGVRRPAFSGENLPGEEEEEE